LFFNINKLFLEDVRMGVKYLCLGLLLGVILPLVPAYGDTNILINPGFEDGTKGWEGRSCEIEAVTTPVHSGKGSARIHNRTETWQGIKQSLLGKVSDGSTYVISGWVKLEDSDFETVIISIEQTDDSGTNYINVATDTAVQGEWIELSGEFTLNASGKVTSLDVYFEGPEPNVAFYVDDVNVYGPAPSGKSDPNTPKQESKMSTSETQTVNINSSHQDALTRQREEF
jgi:hypothetical protein